MSKNFYVDISSVLDTRAGTIRRINSEAYADIIRNGYHLRKGDFFKGIDHETFRQVYEANEVETLMESTVTNVFHFLYPHVTESMKEFIAHEAQAHLKPMLHVNVWPYELTDDEMAMIRAIVYERMRGIIGVDVFSKDIKELTPEKAAEKYGMMVMYDYQHYLNAHSEDLIRKPQPFLMLIGPMVYFNRNPDEDEETIEQLKHGINSLAILEASIAPRICLKFINVDIFSIIYPDDRALLAETVKEDSFATIEDLDKRLTEFKDKDSSAG